jgi:hypothetical protein
VAGCGPAAATTAWRRPSLVNQRERGREERWGVAFGRVVAEHPGMRPRTVRLGRPGAVTARVRPGVPGSAEGYLPEAVPEAHLVLRDPTALDAPDRVAELLVRAGCPPTRLAVEQEGLEEYFLGLVGRSASDSDVERRIGQQPRQGRRAGCRKASPEAEPGE